MVSESCWSGLSGSEGAAPKNPISSCDADNANFFSENLRNVTQVRIRSCCMKKTETFFRFRKGEGYGQSADSLRK